MKCHSFASFFETISNETRMKIIEALIDGSLSVAEICEKTKEEQSKISHNLQRLVQCHFLDVMQDGKRRVYSLNKKTVLPLLRIVEKHVRTYCTGKCKKLKSEKTTGD